MRIALKVTLTFLFMITEAFAAEKGIGIESLSWNLFFIILSGVIGYIVGAIKSFREEKQKAYGEIIPPILKMAYNPQDSVDEKEYSRALGKLWLYGSKKVAQQMEKALIIMHDHSRGDLTRALQEAVAEMRKDIQLFTFQKLKPEAVNHLYTKIVGTGILQRIEALREVKSVIENIPPSLSASELEERLVQDPGFCGQLSNRLIRLFGLRNELIPFLDQDIMKIIDLEFKPLFVIENGSYELKGDKIRDFAVTAHHLKSIVDSVEEKLIMEYRRRI